MAVASAAMEADTPPPRELLNHGEPTRPRPASTVLLVRDGTDGLEVLLVQRGPTARFMASVWVFPGGAVDAHEGHGEQGHRLAAVREVEEETGVRLADPDALVLLSRWVTPTLYRLRFDTWFFLAELPVGPEVSIDGHECVAFAWLTPARALARFRAKEMLMVLPTVSHLEQLDGMSTPARALATARNRGPSHVEPLVVGSGDSARVVLARGNETSS
ncbi:MAG: NUDIX hydrolase [Solirubrobacterales bacterium]|nr:NUDIX hydrolase [Solirubrobacterales bacterium]